MEEASNIITCCNLLAGSECTLTGDRVFPLECHRQLLEQIDGLFDVASDGRRLPSDFTYYIYSHGLRHWKKQVIL